MRRDGGRFVGTGRDPLVRDAAATGRVDGLSAGALVNEPAASPVQLAPLVNPLGCVRILGIDPGSQVTGFGIVDLDGKRTAVVEWGSIRTSGEHSDRLRSIFRALGDIVREYRPAEVAIERVFLSRNADSALKLGQARAAAMCATFAAEVPIYEYSARHIKKAVVGSGGADCRRRGGRARGGHLPRERAWRNRCSAAGAEGLTKA